VQSDGGAFPAMMSARRIPSTIPTDRRQLRRRPRYGRYEHFRGTGVSGPIEAAARGLALSPQIAASSPAGDEWDMFDPWRMLADLGRADPSRGCSRPPRRDGAGRLDDEATSSRPSGRWSGRASPIGDLDFTNPGRWSERLLHGYKTIPVRSARRG
jgi:hypothetical protein